MNNLHLGKIKTLQPDVVKKADKINNVREAAHFLKQATLGATIAEINSCLSIGSRKAWLEDQYTKNYTQRFVDRVYTEEGIGANWSNGTRAAARNAIYQNLLSPDALLRSKCLKALTRIFVLSSPGGGVDLAFSYNQAGWFDRLNSQVFGNFSELLELVSLSYPMSRMLSHFANKKESATQQPDENYAREIMQLFTIGLWQLNLDGSKKLDSEGRPIPTYTNEDIRQLARVFTGWVKPNHNETDYTTITPANDTSMSSEWNRNGTLGIEAWTYNNPTYKMRNYDGFYEFGSKNCLGGLINIPANTDALTGLKTAINALVNHPSCAPFIAKRLIGALVCCNPSPGYIARVASVFRDNGSGVAGDMKAVWSAILLDKEATWPERFNSNKGRILDGIELLAMFLRPLQAKTTQNKIIYNTDCNAVFGMEFLLEPSIFGWYDLTADNPELNFWKPTVIAAALDELLRLISSREPRDTASIIISLCDYTQLPLTGTPEEMVERVNLLYCGGTMSDTLRRDILFLIRNMPISTISEQYDRASTVLNVVIPSVESRTVI